MDASKRIRGDDSIEIAAFASKTTPKSRLSARMNPSAQHVASKGIPKLKGVFMRGTGSVGTAAPARPLVLGAAVAIGLTLALLPHPENALAARDASSFVAQANAFQKSESPESRSSGGA